MKHPPQFRWGFAFLVGGVLYLIGQPTWAAAASVAAPTPTPEQVRQSLVQFILKRFPGTGPADWSLGYAGLSGAATTVVTAIPLSTETATNSADVLAIGKKRWEKKFANGKSFAQCFPNGGKRAAVTYPQIDPATKEIVTAEKALDRCLIANGEAPLDRQDHFLTGALIAYFMSLSEGQPFALRVAPGPARERFEAGKAVFTRRMGDKDVACASCHVLQAGQLNGERGLSFVIGQAATWPRLEPGGNVRTLQRQFQSCMEKMGAEPFPMGAEEFNALEYFLTFLSNGVPLRVLLPHRP